MLAGIARNRPGMFRAPQLVDMLEHKPLELPVRACERNESVEMLPIFGQEMFHRIAVAFANRTIITL